MSYREYFDYHVQHHDYPKVRVEAFEDFIAHRARTLSPTLGELAQSMNDEHNSDVFWQFENAYEGQWDSIGEFACDYMSADQLTYARFMNWEHFASEVLPDFFITDSHNVFRTFYSTEWNKHTIDN
jgi:hypothetical protein